MQLFVYGPTVKSEVSFDFCRGTRVGEREKGGQRGTVTPPTMTKLLDGTNCPVNCKI